MQLSYGNVVSAVRLKDKGELPMNEKQVRDAIESSWDAINFLKKVITVFSIAITNGAIKINAIWGHLKFLVWVLYLLDFFN